MKISQEIIKNIFNDIKSGKNLKSNLLTLNKLLEDYENQKDLLMLKGIVLSQLNLNTEAEKVFESLLSLDKNNIDILYNYSLILKKLNKIEYSFDVLNKILQIKKDHLGALNELGLIYIQKKKLEKAIEIYNEILKSNSKSFNALTNISNIHFINKDLENAELYAKKTIEYFPNNFQAYYNIANIFQEKGNYIDAIENFKKCISLNKNYLQAYVNLSGAYQSNDQMNEAILELDNYLKFIDDPQILIKKIYLSFSICNWDEIKNYEKILKDIGVQGNAIFPFRTLALHDSPNIQKIRSERWSEQFKRVNKNEFSYKRTSNPKIRIGYFSSDFHGHATMHLISGVFRNHDRNNFEIYIYNYSQKQNPKWNLFLEKYSDKIIDVNSFKNVEDLIDRIREDKLDIAIDLKGYTDGSKISIFKNKIAKIHISYLGYPGTLGSDFIDYIIADETVVPMDLRHHYSEKIIYMPHTYQPNDEQRKISEIKTIRSDHNLPNDGFIFCCFNDLYKFTPKEYDIWMRVLNQVDNSYLWLLVSNDQAKENLKKEAKKRNINPERLIFAERIKHEHHLERVRHADLFLDCFNYNAHTTASDALWSGVPLVTLKGQQFSARVASSILKAIGLEELITNTIDDYESLILKLSKNKDNLAKIRKKIDENKKNYPLFNSILYTKNYEALLKNALKDAFDENIKDLRLN